MNAGSDWPSPAGKSSEAQKQELAETILEAHKALIKADPKNTLPVSSLSIP